METFTIYGRDYTLTRGQVLAAAAGWGNVPAVRRYFVRIGHMRFPLKYLFGLAIGLPPADFYPQTAHRVLTLLGFDVEQI